MSIRVLLAGTLAAVLLAIHPPLDAQTVRGRLLEEGSDTPVAATLVVLLDASGAQRGSVLSGDDGRFLLPAPGPGAYRLRAERIGVRGTASPSFHLAAGETLEYTLRVGTQAVMLEPLVARAGRTRCARVGEGGQETVAAWEEARKALNAARHTGRGTLTYRLVRHHRELSFPGLGVQTERTDTVTWTGTSPFVSVPVHRLAGEGFVVRDGMGTTWFAPDAEVLLSDAFLDGHCFRLVAGDSTPEGMLGLRFEPVRGGRTPDVEGTLWLDAATAELRHLEFDFVRLESLELGTSLRRAPLGGSVDFERLPTGGWIASRWSVRMPVMGTPLPEVGTSNAPVRARLVRIAEQGGEVVRVATAAGRVLRTTEASLVGTVHDSIAGAPLAGARVFLAGTAHETRTDAGGAFRLTLPAGAEYRLAFQHAALDSLAYAPPSRLVRVEAGAVDTVHLAVPPLAAIRASRCPPAEGDGTAAVSGTVAERGSGVRLAGATVTVQWEGEARVTNTDLGGRYLFCDVPVGVPVQMDARVQGASGRESFALAAAQPTERHLLVSRAAAPLVQGDVLLRLPGQPVRLTGRILRQGGVAEPNLEVRLNPGGQHRRTDARGRFAFSAVPPGTYRLEAYRGAERVLSEEVAVSGGSTSLEFVLP